MPFSMVEAPLHLLDVAINGFSKPIVFREDIYPLVVILELPEQIAFTQLVITHVHHVQHICLSSM